MPYAVDMNTLNGKLMMGYQGWFACPGDGSLPNRWWHWFGDPPNQSKLTIDMWPDMTELDSTELFPTGMTYLDRTQACLYSAHIGSVVDRHFSWMEEYGLDGVMLQRFVSDLQDPAFKAFRDQVAENVMKSAEAHHRAFSIMYDVTNYRGRSLVDDMMNDWKNLVDDLKVTGSPSYLKHKQMGSGSPKPLLAIWGLGFTDRPGTASQASQIIKYLKTDAPVEYQVTLVGGVPTNWRTPGVAGGDSKPNVDPGAQSGDSTWLDVYKSFDVLSPWSVNRYSLNRSSTKMGADDFANNMIHPDLQALSGSGVEYLPVVFPGYSSQNKGMLESPTKDHPLNEVPRIGGRFWWRQVYNTVSMGCSMIYGAMFDEVDEGTALFKIVADPKGLPEQAQGNLVHLNIDSQNLPSNWSITSDWYLRLAGKTGAVLRDPKQLTQDMPLLPTIS